MMNKLLMSCLLVLACLAGCSKPSPREEYKAKLEKTLVAMGCPASELSANVKKEMSNYDAYDEARRAEELQRMQDVADFVEQKKSVGLSLAEIYPIVGGFAGKTAAERAKLLSTARQTAK